MCIRMRLLNINGGKATGSAKFGITVIIRPLTYGFNDLSEIIIDCDALNMQMVMVQCEAALTQRMHHYILPLLDVMSQSHTKYITNHALKLSPYM